MQATNGQVRSRGPERILVAATLAAVAMLGCSEDDGGSLNPTAPSAVNATGSVTLATTVSNSTSVETTVPASEVTLPASEVTLNTGDLPMRTANGPGVPLTANVLHPASHDGNPFIVDLHFSEPVVTKPRNIQGSRGRAFRVGYGGITKAARQDRARRTDGKKGWVTSHWKLTVEPSGTKDVRLISEANQSWRSGRRVLHPRPPEVAVACTGLYRTRPGARIGLGHGHRRSKASGRHRYAGGMVPSQQLHGHLDRDVGGERAAC